MTTDRVTHMRMTGEGPQMGVRQLLPIEVLDAPCSLQTRSRNRRRSNNRED
jgi:hypothetical protein